METDRAKERVTDRVSRRLRTDETIMVFLLLRVILTRDGAARRLSAGGAPHAPTRARHYGE
ncbi:hypothetical protein GCM10017600_14960 [Streptosporangium carneum]|uniref:Uncharacterized protein n=1 Tax=Streptosporangium carneum TaxID=47481 RepID=A0A9W6HYG2_9ACTN|nr:hypothetical protein GCM10017600_14960 [Streptosporangium carneum]